MNEDHPHKRYSVAEVAVLLSVAPHVLRQWEKRFPELRPKRDRNNRRYYMRDDIEVARRIKQLLRHEKMTSAGARLRLKQELYGEGRPKTRQEALNLLDKVESEVRRMLSLLDEK